MSNIIVKLLFSFFVIVFWNGIFMLSDEHLLIALQLFWLFSTLVLLYQGFQEYSYEYRLSVAKDYLNVVSENNALLVLAEQQQEQLEQLFELVEDAVIVLLIDFPNLLFEIAELELELKLLDQALSVLDTLAIKEEEIQTQLKSDFWQQVSAELDEVEEEQDYEDEQQL